MTLLLTAADVRPLLDLEKAIALTEEVFGELGRGQVDIHSPYHLFVREGALRVVSGALRESGFMGLRCGPTRGRRKRMSRCFTPIPGRSCR